MKWNHQCSNRVISAIGTTCLIVLSVLGTGCLGLPAASHTGKVQEIIIGTVVAPSEVTLAPGDEVRWINRQDGPVSIVFLNPIQDQVNCERGFGLAGVANAAKLLPNKEISLCFTSSGTVRYSVHLDTPTPTGQVNVLGVLHIEKS